MRIKRCGGGGGGFERGRTMILNKGPLSVSLFLTLRIVRHQESKKFIAF